jgi:hypothetical protein
LNHKLLFFIYDIFLKKVGHFGKKWGRFGSGGTTIGADGL